jgi:hypothetical protein
LQNRSITLVAALSAALLSGCMSMADKGGKAPEPRKRIDAARFYAGLWHEIARRPMSFTDGCVAGATEYKPGAGGAIEVLDSCRMGTPRANSRPLAVPAAFSIPARTPNYVSTTGFTASFGDARLLGAGSGGRLHLVHLGRSRFPRPLYLHAQSGDWRGSARATDPAGAGARLRRDQAGVSGAAEALIGMRTSFASVPDCRPNEKGRRNAGLSQSLMRVVVQRATTTRVPTLARS